MKKLISIALCLLISLVINAQTFKLNTNDKYCFIFTDSCVTLRQPHNCIVIPLIKIPDTKHFTNIWISTKSYGDKNFRYELIYRRKNKYIY